MSDSWFFVSFYELFGVPESLAVSAALMFFLISCAPFLSGQKIFGTEFPELSKLQRVVCTLLGPVALLLVVVGFQRSWQDGNQLAQAQPHCQIAATWNEKKSFDLDWYTASESEFSTRLIDQIGLEEVPQQGARRVTWSSDMGVVTYRIVGRNRFGACEDTVDIWNPDIDWDQPFTCELTLDKGTSRIGEEYTLSWIVDAPKLALAWINGTEVEHDGQAIFTFTGPNYDRFRLVVNSGGFTCQADVRIAKEET